MKQIEISFKLNFISPSHIGTGKSSSFINKLVQKDREKKLYIPGSLFKGVFKEKFIQVINLKILNINKEITNKVVNNIFGTPQKEGLLYFDSLYMTSEYENIEYTETRTHNKIFRATRKAQDKSLFNSEYGIYSRDNLFEFSGLMWGNIKSVIEKFFNDLNIKVSYEIYLLYFTLKLMNKLGGSKSIGMGKFKISDIVIKLDENPNIINLFNYDNFFTSLELKRDS